MDKMAVIVALAALGLAGYGHMQAEERNERLDQLVLANGDLRDQITALEVQLDAGLGSDGTPDMLAAGEAAAGSEQPDRPAGLAVRKPAAALERLARLEKTVAAQKETIARLEEEKVDEHDALTRVRRTLRDDVYFNADQAAKALALDERQKSDMQDALERGRAELKDLFAIENDEGVTWNEVRKPKMANLGGGEGSISIALPDFGKISAFKKSRIPGRSETFGEAEKRIREQTFANVRRTLPGDKAAKWDKANKDNLLSGGGAGGMVFSSVVVGSDER